MTVRLAGKERTSAEFPTIAGLAGLKLGTITATGSSCRSTRPPRRSIAGSAALVFTFGTNIDMTTVLTLLPVAVFDHGTTVSPLAFSLALSIQVGASPVGSSIVPIVFRDVNSGWMLSVSAVAVLILVGFGVGGLGIVRATREESVA